MVPPCCRGHRVDPPAMRANAARAAGLLQVPCQNAEALWRRAAAAPDRKLARHLAADLREVAVGDADRDAEPAYAFRIVDGGHEQDGLASELGDRGTDVELHAPGRRVDDDLVEQHRARTSGDLQREP